MYITTILLLDLMVIFCFFLIGFTASVVAFLMMFTLGGGLFVYGIRVKLPLMLIEKFIKKFLGGKL